MIGQDPFLQVAANQQAITNQFASPQRQIASLTCSIMSNINRNGHCYSRRIAGQDITPEFEFDPFANNDFSKLLSPNNNDTGDSDNVPAEEDVCSNDSPFTSSMNTSNDRDISFKMEDDQTLHNFLNNNSFENMPKCT